ncbi:Pyruvate formate-lyase activating enzyme [Salmonella enterica subsp. enterica]|uniref:Pyruvate formate-lyase activating enzyme n=1 Tax=Salmonella enterica I TaxID=59201 RepID=A0A447TQG4_SALET|nr:Pyruvate formate-lyase activating enzyme [Salmonella enterica subsp. enterica]
MVNADTLREAQLRPQDFAGLVVRVAGYSAFFVELSKEIQDDIIRRTAHQLWRLWGRAMRRPRVSSISSAISLNDGQGIRTVVFFKGCPHTCPWCANPESISPRIETVRRENKCLRCTPCLRDADECPSGAFERIGRDITLDELEREVLKDDIFFRTSGGGVTLSGGEVLMQAPFATRFLQRLRRWGVPCAIETAGDTSASRLLPLARACDEVLFDLKIMDAERAREGDQHESAARYWRIYGYWLARESR